MTAPSSTAPAPGSTGGGAVRQLRIRVNGTPAPQGSKRAIPMRNGRVNLVESSKAVGPWREAVRAETQRAILAQGGWHVMSAGPVHVRATFYLPRPRGHYGTGRNAAIITTRAPLLPAGKPDLDKLIRAVLDAITAGGALADDARVTSMELWKLYATPEQPPGVSVTLVWDA